MAHREFIDSIGRRWDVWTVIPELAERRRAATSEQTFPERRHREEYRVPLGAKWSDGWLAFSTAGERRRLAPYPADWIDMSAEQLEQLCARATLTPHRGRLVE